jgi:hypothetical protein
MKATLVSLIACILIVAPACGADTARSGTPLLIELFTSEGCSSCPPADAWLQRIDASQPVPGVELIVLSEHVTYWDHDGWKDPYSRDLYTDRQSNYVRALGLSTPYTPQVIVNGKSELHLNEPQQMKQVLVEAASASRIPVSISTLNVARNGSPILRAHIEVDGEQLSRNADIIAVVALDHTETQVAYGENGGKLLTHVAVAQELVKVGKLEKKKTFSQDIEIKLPLNTDSQALRLVVFVQEPGSGSVLGATFERTATEGKE